MRGKLTEMKKTLARLATALSVTALVVVAAGLNPARAEEAGRVGVDWVGNDIVIDAVEDPEVQGVTCHVAYFDRSLIDRLQQGNWFEDPSNSAIDCSVTGPITIRDIATDADGEEVFNQRRSIIFKALSVTRVYDAERNALVYLGHGREVQQGSAKMSIAVVPLAGADVTWENGAPE